MRYCFCSESVSEQIFFVLNKRKGFFELFFLLKTIKSDDFFDEIIYFLKKKTVFSCEESCISLLKVLQSKSCVTVKR